jgi:hypothetical protein
MRFSGLGLAAYSLALAADPTREWAPDVDFAGTIRTQMKFFLNMEYWA